MNPAPYCGRFAPSPTGPLHLGSLLTAVASWLDARAAQGAWHVRMEDIDPPREVPGADTLILRCLEVHGLTWDGPVVYQSQRTAAYEAALATLAAAGLIYACDCPRKVLRAQGGPYPGICRNRRAPPSGAHALRLRVPPPGADQIAFRDRLRGLQVSALQSDPGDFVIRRRDGLWAYQLAVVVDDGALGATDIVRGEDLLSSTARQLYLQHCLGLPTPRYLHLPLIKDAAGHKWAKQTGAPGLDLAQPEANLAQALALLDLPSAPGAPCEAQLELALDHWKPKALPKGPLFLSQALD